VFLAHGFRNDENDATGLYTRFLETFRQNLERPELQSSLGSRTFVMAGVYWPSKAFKEAFGGNLESVQGLDSDELQKALVREQLEELQASEELSPEQRESLDCAIQLLDEVQESEEAQDELADRILSVLDGADLDPEEGLDDIRARRGSELFAVLQAPIVLPAAGDGEEDEGGAVWGGGGGDFVSGDEGGTEGVGSLFGSLFGRIGQFLNLTTWYLMKKRSGTVGANGVAQAVRDLKASRPEIKIHLVGHSLGGRLMAACSKSLASPKLQPDSVTLLQAAFSHYGFSADNGRGKEGFFRAVVQDQVVRGPLVATFSALDTVVGKVYAVASRLARDANEGIGDAKDPFGGIGRNGTQKTQEAIRDVLHEVGDAYTFQPGKVTSLDGSANLITNHGDVTNPRITYAFASAVAQT
jgi:hypothetical protein